MLFSRSILWRIVSLHVAAICVVSLVIPFAVHRLLSATAEGFQQERLLRHADDIGAYLAVAPDGEVTFAMPSEVQAFYAPGNSLFDYWIVDDRGRVLFSSAADRSPIFESDPLAGEPVYFRVPRGKAIYSGASVPQRVGGRTVWLQVAQDRLNPDSVVDSVVSAFLTRIGWITVPILLVLLAIDVLIFRRALRPVLEASRRASAIEPSRIDVRLPDRDMPRELVPLVKAVNQALDRLERGFRVQREFSENAAHELRTPLAVLRARIDTMGDGALPRALRADIEGMSRIVNQLLEIADLESFTVAPGDAADLHDIAVEVAAYIAPVALAQGKEVALFGAAGPVWVAGNAEALHRALRNVVENAVKFTAPGTTVEVHLDEAGAVRVLDRGPGVAEAERELIFRRFWRGDRRRVGSAGLGLAIVARVVEAHGGTATVVARDGGGAEFVLGFPLAAREAPERGRAAAAPPPARVAERAQGAE